MQTLRGRLVGIVLLVVLSGLIAMAFVTFVAQRSHLYKRADRQATYSLVLLRAQILQAAASPGNNDCRQPAADSASTARDDDDADLPIPPGLALPPGTYGALLDPDDRPLAECIFGVRGADDYALPELARLGGHDSPQTVGSRGGLRDERFRVALRTLPDGRRMVVGVPLTDTVQTLRRLALVELLGIIVILLLLGVTAWLLVGFGLKPLARMTRSADAIADGELIRPIHPADDASEIGRLGAALNRMLERLEQALQEGEQSEQRLRRFLADAAHELRTPLASIRGYAELYRLGAASDDAEIERSMLRIEQQSARMGVLVQDMLTLARIDQVHETSQHAVDLRTLTTNAVHDARAADPSRGFQLQTYGAPLVLGDADQLQQVLANLLRNASQHTPAGSTVEVKLADAGECVRIDVRDHGSGLPDGSEGVIFERFWRADVGGSGAGSGLGLAIVREIVLAHGGSVAAQSCDGGDGARFSIWLPKLV